VVIEGQPHLLNRLTYRTVIPRRPRIPGKRVELITITLGDEGTVIEAIADHVDGLVIAAFGVGHVPANLVPLLGQVAARIPVVLASRTGAGSTLRATYSFPGSERDLLDRGLIPAGFLDPLKARILLHCLLTADADHAIVSVAVNAAAGHADPSTWPWTTTTAARS
jgi:L-asparaginase